MQKIFLTSALEKLKQLSSKTINRKAFVGLDGYIDFIQRAVRTQTQKGPEFFNTIADFASHIGKAAGKSAQIELITQETKLGGNAPIMAEALANLGCKTTCIGNFGKDDIHPIFQQMHGNVTLLSIGDSSMTNALEFHDGKLILSEVGPFKHLDWNYLKNEPGLPALIKELDSSHLVALVDWCNLPYSTDIWDGILREILPKIHGKERHFFFDIADPSRRSDEELIEALDVITGYNQYGKVTLGLNENETEKLYSCLNRINYTQEEEGISLIEQGNYIFKHITIWNLLIHPTNRSISINNDGISELKGRYIQKPKISTGGGDNFNAGYCLGQLLNLDVETSMIIGMANSGDYVLHGQSPSMDGLIKYITNWISDLN